MRSYSLAHIVSTLKPNERVFISGSAGEAVDLSRYLSEHPELAIGVHFFCSFVPGVNTSNLSVTDTRKMSVYFMQSQYEQGVNDGGIEFCPISYNGVLQRLSQANAIDTIILQVSPPDANGKCSLGPQGEFIPAILRLKPRIIAFINPNTPYLAGSPSIAIDDIDMFCESDTALPSYDAGKSNPVSEQIAEHLAALIPDGATLQCGLGKAPSQLMHALRGHRNLQIHSGMISDGILQLLENNSLNLDADIISTVALGSTALYSQLANIPKLRICGVNQSHNPALLAKTRQLIAVNSAMEVDLLGQVNAEFLGGKYLSGPGGLPDFASAARQQQDGLSIIALPAADPRARQSRIVNQLTVNSPVTVPQYNVDVVVSEFGSAFLRDANIASRASRLINIAHPDHREQLCRDAHQRGIRIRS
jgi:acyl-CoA hydrolase